MTPHTPPTIASDEIDLVELFRTLWKSKLLIATITAIVTCMAAAYAFLSPPVYQASVQFLPPTASDLASYNAASQLTGSAITMGDTTTGIDPITPDDAYKIFLRHLGSYSLRQHFFEQYYLPAQKANKTVNDRQQAWEDLTDELTITLPTRPNETLSGITLEGQDPQTIAGWANAYAGLATQAAANDLSNTLKGAVEIRRNSLESQIEAEREVAEHVRQTHITRLRSALTIAENVGLEIPADGAPLIAINTQDLNSENASSSSLLYLRGAKALRSELQQLEQRQNDDAYIADLPNLLKKLSLINSIELSPSSLSAATIDRQAIAPEEPIKPKKALILALGLMLGGMLGIAAALFRHMLRQR